MSTSLLAGPENPEIRPYRPKAVQERPVRAQPFVAGEVTLLDGPFKVAQDIDARNLLSLDVDRLLAPFITASGGWPKAPAYLGWETKLLPGVALSFYLSGASRLFLLTGNREFRNRLDYILTMLEECQIRGDGYLLGTSGGQNIFARVEKEGLFPGFDFRGRGEASPYYALEKLMSGLRDVYRLCGDERALRISLGIGNWLEGHMAHLSDDVLQQLMTVEYGGMNWVLADLYVDSGDPRFLTLSKRWQDNNAVGPMSRGEDVLTGVHANMQFPKFSGLAARYPYSGDPGDLFGARFFWECVVSHRTYATGGNSESEFFSPRDRLSDRLSPFTEENCNEYNMLRLTALLSEIEPRVEYDDYTERTLFNHLLGAQNPADGRLCYFTPLMSGAAKFYQPLEFFSCCTASGLDSYARPAEYIYSREGDAVYVHQFIASIVRYEAKGVMIRQDTSFPDGDTSTLTVRCSEATEMELRIRDPHWAEGGVRLALNGQPWAEPAARDGYFHLRRKWAEGDSVKISFPMRLRAEVMPDDPSMIALFCGPILLCANLEPDTANKLAEVQEAPALVPEGKPLALWLEPDRTPLTYVTAVARPSQLRLIPFYLKTTGPYAIYWQVLTDEQWRKRLEAHQKRIDQARRVDHLTIDRVVAGDAEEELRHHLAGASQTGKGNGAILPDRVWRTSTTDAFSYELAVDGTVPNALCCRFMGRQAYEAWNCRITVDNTPVQILDRQKDDSYPVIPWQAIYPIPPELTRGKASVTIRFEPLKPHKLQMPRLMELRTLRVEQSEEGLRMLLRSDSPNSSTVEPSVS